MTLSYFIIFCLYAFVLIVGSIEALVKKDIWCFLTPFLTLLIMAILIFSIYFLGIWLGLE